MGSIFIPGTGKTIGRTVSGKERRKKVVVKWKKRTAKEEEKMALQMQPRAIPEVGAEPEEYAKRRHLRRRGRRKTVITGTLEPEPTGKKRVLG